MQAMRKCWRTLLWLGTLAIIWACPVPQGLTPQVWHLFAVFAATIFGFMLRPQPMPVVAMFGMVACSLGSILTPRQVLAGYGDTSVWIVALAFFMSVAFDKTGLGRRVACLFIARVGRSPLGLCYATSLTNMVLAPVIPSNAARLGGMIFPLQKSIALAYDSDPAKGTERLLGSYIMANGFYANTIVSAMFLTAAAFNPVIVGLAEGYGVHVRWLDWFAGGLVPGLICLVILPLVLAVVYPPQIRSCPEAAEMARRELAAMGPVSPAERTMLVIFAVMLLMWTLGVIYLGVNVTMVTLGGLVALILFGVLDWEDVVHTHSAWGMFIWLGAIMGMAGQLNELGFITWFTDLLSHRFEGMDWHVACVAIILCHVYSHYFFASIICHTIAMAPAFLALLIGVGTPPALAVLLLGYSTSLMGGLTHYGNGSGPIFTDSGYLPVNAVWCLGLLLSIVFLLVFGLTGPAWWSLIGMV